MITKTYLTEIPYEIKLHHLLDSWVGRGNQVSLSIMRDDNKERETIGMMRPIRWWRHSTYREIGGPDERMVLCFAVRHTQNPYARLGDLSGGGYKIVLDTTSKEVKAARVEKREK